MQLSIVIPTRNESNNVIALTERIADVLSGLTDYEIIFVDDSDDETPMIINSLQWRDNRVRMIHREGVSRNGLAGAVIDGFKAAYGRYLVVMDADLQHPPEMLPNVLWSLQKGVDIVIPSRFIPGGSDGGLNAFRKFVSWSARTLGNLVLPQLRKVTDSTSGFFGINRFVLLGANLSPIGWKILIEILVKCHYKTVVEIPYKFQARHAGDSKMSMREQINYLVHLVKLRLWTLSLPRSARKRKTAKVLRYTTPSVIDNLGGGIVGTINTRRNRKASRTS